MDLIPAIDIIGGQCVRLTQGSYASKRVYDLDPLELAKQFEGIGLSRLHIVDLDGAKAHRVVNAATLERIATHTSLSIDFGGGLHEEADVRRAFDAGADMVTVGSLAVSQPETLVAWADIYGHDRFIIAADAKDGFVQVNGWQSCTREQLLPFIGRYIEAGFRQYLCTDIDRDGMLQGPATDLYKDILTCYPNAYLIASGGVSSVDDLRTLSAAGIPAAVFGKALYEGRITLNDLCSLNA